MELFVSWHKPKSLNEKRCYVITPVIEEKRTGTDRGHRWTDRGQTGDRGGQTGAAVVPGDPLLTADLFICQAKIICMKTGPVGPGGHNGLWSGAIEQTAVHAPSICFTSSQS